MKKLQCVIHSPSTNTSLIKKKISGPIIVTNGDVITDINYADMLKFHEKKIKREELR